MDQGHWMYDNDDHDPGQGYGMPSGVYQAGHNARPPVSHGYNLRNRAAPQVEVGVVNALAPMNDLPQYPADFTCGVCYELMIEPTTLQCGHSFCRHCLASAFIGTEKQECPSCRQRYNSLPRVSYAIRSTIQNQFPDEYAARERFCQTPETQAHIQEFERRFAAAQNRIAVEALTRFLVAQNAHQRLPQFQQQQQLQRVGSLWSDPKTWLGLFIICAATIVVWSAVCWMLGLYTGTAMVSKPMTRWTEEETRQWITELGPWTKDTLVPKFTELHIDGLHLAAMQPEDLGHTVSGLDDLHKRAFILARDDVIMHGSKYPSDVWEFKEIYLFKTTWGTIFCQYLPRAAIFYLWLFDYEASFLPLIHSTCPVLEMEHINLFTYDFPSPTRSQWIDFTFRCLFFPNLTVFAHFTWTNVWEGSTKTAAYMIACLTLNALNELLFLILICSFPKQRRLVEVFAYILQLAGTSLMHGTVFIMWNFIPLMIIQLFFYLEFLGSFIHNVKQLGTKISIMKTLNN